MTQFNAKQALLNKAKALRASDKVEQSSSIRRAIKRCDSNVAPLSFSQERLWVTEQVEGINLALNMQLTLELKGQLNLEQLQHAVNQLVQRHSALRTRFIKRDNAPVQEVLESVDTKIAHFHACQNASMDEKLAWVKQRFLETQLLKPFDLEQAPLLRVSLFELSQEHYVLGLVMHHIVSDGWSMNIISSDLVKLYNGHELTQPEIRYIDYTFDHKCDADAVLAKDLAFWQQKLEGSQSSGLPYDAPLSTPNDVPAGTHSVALSANTSEKIDALCRQHKLTAFSFFLTLYQFALGCFNNSKDVCVGISSANREQEELHSVVGFFVNILTSRLQWNSEECGLELLGRGAGELFAMLQHQSASYHHVVDEVLASDAQRRLFSAHFFMNPTPQKDTSGDAQSSTSLTVAPYPVEAGYAVYDLSFNVVHQDDGYHLHFRYDQRLYSEKLISWFGAYLGYLIETLAEKPATKLVELNLNGQHKELLSELGLGPQKPAQAPDNLVAAFINQVQQKPEQQAIVSDRGSLTYEALSRRVMTTAHELKQFGIEQGESVAICLPRGADMIIAQLAVLTCGAYFVPVDPTLSHDVLEKYLNLSAANVIICSEDNADELPVPSFMGPELLLIDELEWQTQYQLKPLAQIQADDLCYMMFTSGSTGEPKGVRIPHKGVLRVGYVPDFVSLEEVKTVLHASTCAFDASTFEVWAALCNGLCLAIYPPQHIEADRLQQFIETHHVDLAWFTAALFNQLIDHAPALFSTLKLVFAGGEALSAQHIGKLQKLHPGLQIYNGYGPTESTTFTCVHKIEQQDGQHNTIPIGRPIQMTQVYLLNEADELVPAGAIGEICIAGDGLARDYFVQPELTDKAFFVHPELGRLYRSGDLGRWNAQGNLDFKGRKDHQLKINGYRIEPEQIAQCLLAESSVCGAYVTAMHHEQSGKRQLVGYIQCEDGCKLDKQVLKAQLYRHLPKYMCPALWVQVGSLPITANGKVDTKALPAVSEALNGNAELLQDFPHPIAKQLNQAVKQVLGLENIYADQNFFELGGDSILAIQLKSELNRIQLDLEIEALFEAVDFAYLVNQLTSLQQEQSDATQPFSLLSEADAEQVPVGIVDAFPLLSAQQGMWYQNSLHELSSNYHDIIGYTFAFQGKNEQLADIVGAMTQRHPILKTSFNLQDYSQPLQLIHDNISIPLQFDDLCALSHPQQQQLMNQWVEHERRHSFTENQLLWKMYICKLSEQTYRLWFSFHHAILDGWSEALLSTEFVERLLGKTDFAPLTCHFREAVEQERKALASQPHHDFWQSQLAQSEPMKLPMKHVDGLLSEEEAHISFSLDHDQTQALKANAAKLEVPLKTLMLGAHLKALSLVTNSTSASTTIVMNGRPEKQDGDKVVGLFLSTVPLCTSAAYNNWREYIQAVYKLEADTFKYRHYPLSKIISDSGLKNVEQVLFNYTDFHVRDNAPGNTAVNQDKTGYTQTGIPLQVDFSPTGDVMSMVLHYSAGRFDNLTAHHILATYKDVIAQLTASFEELKVKFAEPVLSSFTAEAPVFKYKTVMESLAAVQSRGNAIVADTQKIDHQELPHVLKHYAKQFYELGVTPNEVVALALNSNEQQLLFTLALWYCGVTVVPLAPHWPQQRASLILKQSGAAHFIADEAYISESGANFIAASHIKQKITAEQNLSLGPQCQAEQTAYVIFTSGTTGTPKGVEVTHQQLATHLESLHSVLEISVDDVCTSFCSKGFDAWFELALHSLTQGACFKPCLSLDTPPEQIIDWLKMNEITVLDSTPGFISNWVQHSNKSALAPSLHTMIIGGEALPTQLANRLFNLHPNLTLVNAYGPTETVISASYAVFKSQLPSHQVSIGRALPGRHAIIVDENHCLVPVGTPGQLAIAGVIAKGYLNDKPLTDSHFVEINNKRFYLTGDQAVMQADGNMHYLRRKDSQVKLGGVRINLEEIESAVLQLGNIINCAVKLISKVDVSILVAYIQTNNQQASASFIKRQLSQYLHTDMIPGHIVFVEELPLTSLGKVDKDKLPEPKPRKTGLPQTTTEKSLCSIWSRFLGSKISDRFVDFFEQGGASLTALHMLAHIEQTLGVKVTVYELMSHSELFKLAEFIDEGVLRQHDLVHLRHEQNPNTLFLFSPVEGDVFGYQALALSVNAPVDIVGFTHPLLSESEPKQEWSINQLANRYAEQIKANQPTGHILLAGWSFGGIVATEVAKLLLEQNIEVSWLGLIDSDPDDTAQKQDVNFVNQLTALPERIQDTLKNNINALRAYIAPSNLEVAGDYFAAVKGLDEAQIIARKERIESIFASNVRFHTFSNDHQTIVKDASLISSLSQALYHLLIIQ